MTFEVEVNLNPFSKNFVCKRLVTRNPVQNTENNESIPETESTTDLPDSGDLQNNATDPAPKETQSSPENSAVQEDSGDDNGPPIQDESDQTQTDKSPEAEIDSEVSDETNPDENDGEEQDPSPEISTISVVEAVLFAADEPVTIGKLSEIVGAGGVRDIKKHIQALNTKYNEMDCAFRIESIAGGYQLLTQSKFNPWLSKLIKVRSESKLTPAAMETLAIIAYKQPILRVDIENVRGVAAGEMVRQLIEKGVVKIVGRAEELGRPLLYGTTKKFLEVFGLGSLKDLPTLEDAKKRD